MTFTPAPRRGRVNHERTTPVLIAIPAPIPAPSTRTTPTREASPTTPPPEVDTAVPEEPSIDHDGDDGGMSLPGCPSRAAPPPPASQTTSRELTSGVLASAMLGSRAAPGSGDVKRIRGQVQVHHHFPLPTPASGRRKPQSTSALR